MNVNLTKINVLTFSKGFFQESEKLLYNHLKNLGIDNIIRYTDLDLPVSFIEKHKTHFIFNRGFGYWIWKPFIILNELEKLNDNDILIYVDSTDIPSFIFFEIVYNHLNVSDLYLLNRGYNNGEWTKRDCFVMMDCDEDKYHNSLQLEAGILSMKKTEFTINLMKEWYQYCSILPIIDDSPNKMGKNNLPNFKEHRHDQSILTNLTIKYKLNSFTLPKSVIGFNVNQPKIYG